MKAYELLKCIVPHKGTKNSCQLYARGDTTVVLTYSKCGDLSEVSHILRHGGARRYIFWDLRIRSMNALMGTW